MTISRDERTIAVENASYRIGYQVMSFGLLVLIAYRSFVRNQSSWDLLALVIAAGIVPAVYQGANRVLNRRWTVTQMAALGLGVLLAALIALFAK
jgi:hypothetical protein